MSEASANPFAALPSDAEGHFRFYVYAVVARMLANLEASGASAEGGDNLLERVSLRRRVPSRASGI